jgi:hypothetical protein
LKAAERSLAEGIFFVESAILTVQLRREISLLHIT